MSEQGKRRLCAHADANGEGMHWLEPGEQCDQAGRQVLGEREIQSWIDTLDLIAANAAELRLPNSFTPQHIQDAVTELGRARGLEVSWHRSHPLDPWSLTAYKKDTPQ